MLVKDVMTKEIIALPPDETIESAAVAMTHHGISSLIVRGESHVLGILTERDVLTRVVARGENPSEVRVRDVMTSELISVNPETSIDEASELMLRHRIKKLPIVDPVEPDRVVGILSLTDVALVKPQLIKEFKALEAEEQDIHKLVRQDESQHLELKASLRFNSRRQCLDPDLEFNCLKSVCAFLNADGGDLLIGVNDRNRVVGLKHDYRTFNKSNRDAFENFFVNQISQKIGNRYLQYINVTFPRAYGKEICRVNVKPSHEPAFLFHSGRQYFYVRAGNGSRPFNIKDSARYMVEKWPELMTSTVDATAQQSTQPAS
jgi:CBS domain-containing protein